MTLEERLWLKEVIKTCFDVGRSHERCHTHRFLRTKEALQFMREFHAEFDRYPSAIDYADWLEKKLSA